MSEFEQHSEAAVPTPVPSPVPSQPSISVPATGHAAVDRILGRLEGLDELPVSEHVRVFEEVLTGLRSALADAGEPADTSA